MKTGLLVIILCLCVVQCYHAQEEDGVVALNLPVRTSLTFNRYLINPTFSFVREQHKFISIYNKREWVQFEDAPLTYLGSFNGRFAENIGAGIGVFQQNYGVLTTFGGLLNFAYNAQLQRDSNLTFGLNIGAYKSGVNTGNVVTNFDDPALQNVPENFLMTISPGINYGLAFFDIGLAVNNLVTYNFNASELLEDNPERSIQGHIMYTGYMSSNGFLDNSKFTGLLRSEFREDDTVIAAQAMLTVPRGIWAQVGYNTTFGVSGGLGINLTEQFALEYNFERTMGDLEVFGPSHDITLAYRFKNNQRFDYGPDDDVAGLINTTKRKATPNKLKLSKEEVEARRLAAAEKKAQEQAERALRLEEQQKAREEAQAQRLAEQKAKEEAETQAKLLAEQKAKEEAQAQAKLLAEQKAKEEAQAQAKLLAEQKAKEEAEAQAKLLAEQKAKEEAEAQAKLLAEQQAKEEAQAQAKLLAEQKAKEEAEAQAKEEAEAQAKLLAEQQAKEEAEAQARLLEEQKAKEEAEAQARLLEEQKAKEEAEAQARLLEEQKAKEEAEAQAKLLAEQQAKEEAEAKLQAERDAAQERIANPQDEVEKNMYDLAKLADSTKTLQDDLMKQFDAIVAIKNQDLMDLKEENDLGEQGIAVAPKPFKSITAENQRLELIKAELAKVIAERGDQIAELKKMYEEKYNVETIILDEVYLYYQKALTKLTEEQAQAIEAKKQLELRLADIAERTEFERRRRIKRAAFDNEEERYNNDRATLDNIKKITPIGEQTFTVEDFDFGEEQSNNITILKNVNNVDKGYYLIIAVHTDIAKRDDFITKAYASGRTDVDFFYDVNTSKYYIYYNKFDFIQEANEALTTKENKPYNEKMSLIKIEN